MTTAGRIAFSLALAVVPVAIASAAIIGDTAPAPVRFGIYPGGPVGTVGITDRPVGENATRRVAALDELAGGRAGRRNFVVRLYGSFTGNPARDAWVGRGANAGVARQIHEYVARDFLVELVLRYQPNPDRGGASVAGFSSFVHATVRRFARDPRVRFLQVTNEANVTAAPDSSDGAYAGARRALIAGTEAAARAVRATGGHLQIGFNWAYTPDPGAAAPFWRALRRANARWRTSIDWVGIDIYPGTFYDRGTPPSQLGVTLIGALRTLRAQMTAVGLAGSVPIQVSEAGYPTSTTHTARAQSIALAAMVHAVVTTRAAFDVTDFYWFDLRDSNSAAADQQEHYGLMTDSYTPKPAFWRFKALIANRQ